MTPPTTPRPNPSIAKAAEGAAKEINSPDAAVMRVTIVTNRFIGLDEKTMTSIILRHLAPVQKELDEAHIFIMGYIETLEVIIEVMPETDEKVKRFRSLIAKAQAWLARNGVGL